MSTHATITLPRTRRRTAVRRLRWYMRLALVALFAFLFMRLVRAFQPAPTAAVAIPLTCNLLVPNTRPVYEGLPDTRYVFSEKYGWFDSAHFGTGNPDDLIADVAAAVAQGGGTLQIHQGVQDGIIGYTGEYEVAAGLADGDVIPLALGIYEDWSMRFEAWQARPPHGLASPESSFAVEDLPSQYIGFFAAARGMAVDDVFACYLGPVHGSADGPPALILQDRPGDESQWPSVAWLRNRSFQPLVETEFGWQPVLWPPVLRLDALREGDATFRFIRESTWVLGDGSERPRALEDSGP